MSRDGASAGARGGRVLLVTPPWATIRLPSIQLATLGAALDREGIPHDQVFLNVDLAARVGVELYEAVAEQPFLLGEILAASFAFPGKGGKEALDAIEQPLAWQHGRVAVRTLDQLRASYQRLADGFAAMLEAFLASRDFSQYALAGLTSTFEQNVPALAVARRLKELRPKLPIVIGGSNCEGVMGEEMCRAFPQVDYVVRGEGEAALPELFRALRDGTPPERVAGVIARRDGQVVMGPERKPLERLDELPVPDFGPFLAALERSQVPIEPRLQLETSRGCWWGVKHLCTFCGLNPNQLTYRSKSAARVLEEVRTLVERHGVNGFNIVDNILDARYFTTLLPGLVELRRTHDTDFFVELKANVTHEQVALLDRAGFLGVQPGIESFNDRILSLMDKGITALGNVQAIRWFTEHYILCKYGILLDTIGEQEADYEQILDWIPFLLHLQPPSYVVPTMLHRFSPNFEERATNGLTGVVPVPQYEQAYPPSVDVSRLGFYFDHDRTRGARLDGLHRVLQQRCEVWRARFRPGMLTYERGPDFVRVSDLRGERQRQHLLSGWEAELYLACDRMQPLHKLALPGAFGPRAEELVARLVAERLLLRDGKGMCLSLAVAAEPPRPARIAGKRRPVASRPRAGAASAPA